MTPIIHESAFIAPSAIIIGKITIGKKCGVYPHAVIRADENTITIDDGSNIQDCCIIHCDKEHKVTIGKNVSIGHGAILHGATIENNCLIGINATILNGAVIREGSIIGANALVTTDMEIPRCSLVLGIPGKVVKTDEKFLQQAQINAETYQQLSQEHLQGKHPVYKK
jgi:carbonic anhydrase/acetyltransferase-like protein (isoleucine patch superfamily)